MLEKAFAAARRSIENARSCKVGVASHTLWGAGRNRSYDPFVANFRGDLTAWISELDRELRIVPPTGLSPEEKAIDPRLTVAAFVDEAGKPIATWATWCCHPTTVHRDPIRGYHRDWPGVAVDLIERETGAFGVIHMRANGDVTPLPSGAVRVSNSMERVREIGTAIGDAWKHALNDAVREAKDIEFELGFKPLVPRELGLPTFEIGWPVMTGSEEFDGGFLTQALGEKSTLSWRRPPQGPKVPALGPLQFPLRKLRLLKPAPEHPMWLMRLGAHLFFASPFEITTYAARTVEKTLRTAWEEVRGETLTVSPVGLVGDYSGYVTTPAEYELQNYEGGHTIYGRGQLDAVERCWKAIVARRMRFDAPALLDETVRHRADEAIAASALNGLLGG
jgi:neutral ceramidase